MLLARFADSVLFFRGCLGELPRALYLAPGAALDDVAVREDRSIEIPRLKPIEELEAFRAPAAQQQSERAWYRGAVERTIQLQQKARIR